MNQNVPFPPTLVRISREGVESLVAQRNRIPGSIFANQVLENAAVIRSPDGSLRAAGDQYLPTHKPGEEPGLGKVAYRANYEMLDRRGDPAIVPDVLSFESVADIEKRLGRVDRTAAALVILPSEDPDNPSHMVVAANEEKLAKIHEEVPAEAKILRATIRTLDDEPMKRFSAQATGYMTQFQGASSQKKMAELLRKSYPFIGDFGRKKVSDDAVFGEVAEEATRYNWYVSSAGEDRGVERLREAIRDWKKAKNRELEEVFNDYQESFEGP